MKIAVLVSGGVDSSVALRLLHAAGHELTAFYLKIWLEDELAHLGACPWEDDLEQVRTVCSQIGVPLEVVPLQREYHQRVVRHAVDELRAGRTPSPDIWCNRRIKFGAFFDHLATARGTGGAFDRVASGHYALIEHGAEARPRLLRAVDPVKDQTYFLCRLDEAQLSRLLFPLGGLPKAQVRRLAAGFGLPNRDRPDSQGICFLGDIAYDDFVRAHLGERPGPIRDRDSGQVLGEHRGHWFFTLGQRRGLGLPAGPWYVVNKDPCSDTVWVAQRRALPRYAAAQLIVDAPRWIGLAPAPGPVGVRVRHSPHIAAARWRRLDASRIEIRLAHADPGAAPGQEAVLYGGRRCLGGGTIQAVGPAAVSTTRE
ncbi:MAG: tRNA 2-thiouridine(34) synthase MnmA [Acidobacteriota bacterium]